MRDQITVYIRRGAYSQEREISFRRPDRISESDMREMGIRIDGNQCFLTVYPRQLLDLNTGQLSSYYACELDPEHDLSVPLANSLPGALAQAEAKLVAFLEEKGYRVEFA